jgi:class 3 adenylate cyclase
MLGSLLRRVYWQGSERQHPTAERSVEATATERRLAAILAADVVGYSRLVENDDAGTFGIM